MARVYGNRGYQNDPFATLLINLGIPKPSLHMALGNFLSLFNRGGLSNTSKAQRSVFVRYAGFNMPQLKQIAGESLLKESKYGSASISKPIAVMGAKKHPAISHRKYERPKFLHPDVSQETYIRWLRRKADAHIKRDKKRGNTDVTREAYRIAIHNAVAESHGQDAYTREKLDWKLISKYDNKRSKLETRKYKAKFALLPTIDHVGDGKGEASFKICAWRTNSAKSDLSLPEFVKLCQKIVAHCSSD